MERHGRREYIAELKTGPKTTRDMVLSLMVCGSSVARMMKKLRKDGVVKSSRVTGVRGNVWRHELIEGWETNSINQSKPVPPRILVEEIRHVAMLRDRGLVGQRLHAEHIKTHPTRSYSSMQHIVEVARERKMCK